MIIYHISCIMYQFASYFTSYLTIISTSIHDLWILLNFLWNILHVYHFQSEKNHWSILCFKFQRFFPLFICTIVKYFPIRVHQYTMYCKPTFFRDDFISQFTSEKLVRDEALFATTRFLWTSRNFSHVN